MKPANIISSENARDMHRLRKEKAARLLRQEISLAQLGTTHQPVAALAAVGAQLWTEIAANPDANARYRLETWQTLGRHMDILGDDRQKDAQDGINITIGADLARDMVAQIINSRKKD
jgi:hypothetical protein